MKYSSLFLQIFSELENRKPYETLTQIFGSNIVQFAVNLQNCMHPKNHHRTEAVSSKEYKLIKTEEEAFAYLSNLLSYNLNMHLLGVESEVVNKYKQQASDASLSLLLHAPDVYYMMAILQENHNKLINGAGARSEFFKLALTFDPAMIKDYAQKL